MLKQIIATEDSDTNSRLRKVAAGENGLLARDIDKDRFEIISNEELQQILDGTDTEADVAPTASLVEESTVGAVTDEGELELVSTQMLRTILGAEDENQVAADEAAESGFDPYVHS